VRRKPECLREREVDAAVGRAGLTIEDAALAELPPVVTPVSG